MRLQILSDVHLEARRGAGFDFDAAAPVLALLGDVGDPGSAAYTAFMLRQAERFERVLVLLGNHECYGRTPEAARAAAAAVCALRPERLTLLEPGFGPDMRPEDGETRLADGTAVLGCTLWSEVLDEQRAEVAAGLNDLTRIEGWSLERMAWAHARQRAWLERRLRELEAEERVAVVLTHHAPSFLGSAAPEFAGSAISSAFATELDHLLRPPCVLWAHGHTHWSYRARSAGGALVCANCVGYPDEFEAPRHLPPPSGACVVDLDALAYV